ncbi:hypothetical protein KUTeg_014777 [Tegillarca granosa]|uniref:Deacetylase sirtuin-type domain-containing protein n=1 Tax=Tegillarca granosa TaxID=220873 RepID=A0ABQ9ER17_TEGGR|nr:hypothetical protein KUTeg_014777 [Tegillarca granosa]
MELQCHLKVCKELLKVNERERVEVKTVLPTGGLNASKTQTFRVLWKNNGEAVFHKDCWTSLLKAARARKKYKDLPDLTVEEKVLVKEAAKTAEFFYSMSGMKEEAKRVVEMIRKSEFCVVFTGAGISTSAGIGDYRGKSGKWTEMDQNAVNMDSLFGEESTCTYSTEIGPPTKKAKTDSEQSDDLESDDEEDDGVPYESLRPTYTHEALQKLIEIGHVKHIISQNGDGLHTLSGVSYDKISELHGNVFIEKCEKCGERFERDFYVMDDVCSQYYEELEDYGKTNIIKPKHAKQCELCNLSHRTGRKCSKNGCKGYLIDTIINFRDNLEEEILNQAENISEQCDLMICLGSTLTVTPACDLVEMIKIPQRLVICNRQKTEKDNVCLEKDKKGITLGSRIFGDCDTFMREIMKNIMPSKDLEKWEASRNDKMKIYDTKRNTDIK